MNQQFSSGTANNGHTNNAQVHHAHMNGHRNNGPQPGGGPGPNHVLNNQAYPPSIPQTQSRLPPPRMEQNKMVGVAQFFSSSKPFEAVPYTEDEFLEVQTSLDKTLGPEYVSSRPGAGGSSVAYLEGWKALNIANEIFGFNGWNSELVGYTLDFCDVSRDGRISMGLSVVVRVTIKDGTYHEDIGYGYIENAKNKAAAYEKCKKEALTDGVKRCLRCFGNVLGNCLYDKTLTSKLRGIPKQQTGLGADDFYRDNTISKLREHRQNTNKVNIMMPEPDHMAPQTKNTTTSDTSKPTEKPKTPASKPTPMASPSQDEFDDSFLFSDDVDMHKIDDYEMEMIMNKSNKENEDPEAGKATKVSEPVATASGRTGTPQSTATVPPATTTPATTTPAATSTAASSTTAVSVATPNIPATTPTANPPASLPLFVSAKKADLLKTQPNAAIPEFDPKFVSPNIRRTLDPSKSVPVKRSDIKPLQTNNEPSTSQTPSKPGKRMIGMPPTTRQASKRVHKE